MDLFPITTEIGNLEEYGCNDVVVLVYGVQSFVTFDTGLVMGSVSAVTHSYLAYLFNISVMWW